MSVASPKSPRFPDGSHDVSDLQAVLKIQALTAFDYLAGGGTLGG
jgi:hypothetical protein